MHTANYKYNKLYTLHVHQTCATYCLWATYNTLNQESQTQNCSEGQMTT